MNSELIYDWNKVPGAEFRSAGRVLLNDESLRDGLQSPSVRDPSIAEKIEILNLMEALGINALDLGLPGAGPRAVEHVEALAREIVKSRLKIKANCAARTHQNDIRPIAEISQRVGLPIEAAMKEMQSMAGRQFCPDCVEAFVRVLKTTGVTEADRSSPSSGGAPDAAGDATAA